MAKKLMASELEVGTTKQGYMLLQRITNRSKNTAQWCDLELCDGESVIKAKHWNVTKETIGITEKEVIGVEIRVEEYNGSPSYVVTRCCSSDYEKTKLIPADFAIKAPLDSLEMYDEIISILMNAVSNSNMDSITYLAKNIFEKNKEKLLAWSAAESIHHNMYGGLLYHTLRMVRQALVLCEVYPSLNKELLVSATVLHDIGKLEELSTDALGCASYTIDGQLFGHAHIGMNLVMEEAKKGNYDGELVKCLCHCIASHHGKLEWGAITLPHIEEAAVLHYIDMIDSRIQQYETAYEKIEAGTTTEEKIFGLDNIKVYKPFFK